jgi:hypothetical protein
MTDGTDLTLSVAMPLELRGALHDSGACQLAPLTWRCASHGHRERVLAYLRRRGVECSPAEFVPAPPSRDGVSLVRCVPLLRRLL